jgi:hypothetical protein
MITIQDVEYFDETISDLERAILNVDLFNHDLYGYYLNVVQKFNEFKRAFKFKVLPATMQSYKIVEKHISEFLFNLYSVIKYPDLKQHRQFMHTLYYDMKSISLELQAVQINLRNEKSTLDLLLKFPHWLSRHQQNGDFYNYEWVYDTVNKIETDAPKFFSLFANEFNEMRNLAMNPNIPEQEKKRRMDELIELMIQLDYDLLRASVE